MSSAIAPSAIAPVEAGRATVLALARTEARRFARHPLFLFGIAVMVFAMGNSLARHDGGGANPMTGTLLIAFLIGVFGFVVAHRLTTSLLRSRELTATTPVGRQQRTAALCFACVVPAFAAVLVVGFMLITAAVWPPVGKPASASVAWFGDYPAIDVLAALLAMGPVAAVGGPLLGVAVARWAPFRGSALLGVVTLVFLTALPGESSSPWRLLSAWPVLVDESDDADGSGADVSSSFVPDVEPIWVLGYLLCLCGLAVVAALLRDAEHRRGLLAAGAALAVGAVGCFVLAVS